MALQKDFYQMKAQGEFLEMGEKFVNNAEISIDPLDKGIAETGNIINFFIPGWRMASLHVIDKLNNRIFLISEPYWPNENHSAQETARKRLYDVYTECRSI